MERIETKGLTWPIALLIAAILTLVSAMLARMMTAPANTIAQVTKLPCSAAQSVEPLLDGVVYADNTHIHALDSNGRPKWNYMVGQGLKFDASEYGVIGWKANEYYLLDAEKGSVLTTGNAGEPVISATMGAKYAAVLYGADKQNSTLRITMNNSQSIIDEIELPNLTVLQFGFFNNGEMLWVMSMDTEGTVPMSQLTTYKPGRMQSGNITDSDQVVYRVMFESPNVYTVGTTYIREYDYTGVENTAGRKLVYGWYLMDMDGSSSGSLMAFAPMAQVGNRMSVSDVRMIQGSTDRTVHMPFPCFDLAVRNGRVYGFSGQYVMSHGLNDRKATVTQLPVPCSGMLGITANNKAILVSDDDTVYLVSLP